MAVVERRRVDALRSDVKNARSHDGANLAAISKSLEKFGQQKPIVVDPDGVVVCGNGTLSAAASLGWEKLDVVVTDLPEHLRQAYAIADNRTSELAVWNELLIDAVEELKEHGVDADLLGFSDADLAEIAVELGAHKPVAEDPGPGEPPPSPVARLGDVWTLGDHRLLCGDSTDRDLVVDFVGDDIAALCATDPPYAVDYKRSALNRPVLGGEQRGSRGKDWSSVYHEIDVTEADGFYGSLFDNVLSVSNDDAAIYCWHAHAHTGRIQGIWKDRGILDHQLIVWSKPVHVLNHLTWYGQHEICLHGWKAGNRPLLSRDENGPDVWEVDYDGAKASHGKDHPTQKPVELFARPMRKHTRPGDICFEPFSGSGSQIIACEQEGRRCRAIEIEPTFIDVAINRWQVTTEKVATLDGIPFDEVKQSREEDQK